MRALFLTLMLPLAACVHVPPVAHHNHGSPAKVVQSVGFSQLEQAESDYALAMITLEANLDQLSDTPPADENSQGLSQRGQALGLADRAYVSLTDMRAAYAKNDPVLFERAAGELRLVSSYIYHTVTGASQ